MYIIWVYVKDHNPFDVFLNSTKLSNYIFFIYIFEYKAMDSKIVRNNGIICII